ncbi:MAG: hypothetical protein M0Z94_14265 [Dehalococcoidales bacterium]|nr:hypothetical protein [Dehalococcoidales bacterium]
MPIYEYECRHCGVRFERRQSVHEDPVKDCPDCGGAVRRVLFPVGIIFKGSGFYVTDSRRPQPIGDNGSNGTNGSKAKGEESKSEAKPSGDSTSTKETTSSKA